MAIAFSVDEIFEMAEQIERNGAKFYREAARRASDEALQKIFIDLAAMEDGHLKIFQEMRKRLGVAEKEPMTFDPDNEGVLFLQAMADSHGTEGKKGHTGKLTGNESMREIFEIAVAAEKDSIIFYTAIKGLVDTKDSKGHVEAIIDEELGHLAVLKVQMAGLK